MRQEDAFHVQHDAECLSLYIKALEQDGKSHLIAEKLQQLSKPSETSFLDSKPQPEKEFTIRTNLDQWEKATGRNLLPPNSRLRGSDSSGPIQVVVSEAWSWGKFSRTVGLRILYGVLILTGLSVVLDQQGVIKSGMNTSEVEPHSMDNKITFADVQGVDEAKEELQEVVEFLKEPHKFSELGAKLPKGVLLHGPPGTGKTHLARAIAGEAGVPFFQMSGSEFDELYVGVGARRVRELFTTAKKRAPCIIFIDELDAVGSKRSMKDQSYMRQTLNQLLVELDGFSSNSGVIVIAATNTPESLDKALVRPGRFDRMIPVPLPDVKGRAQILKVHTRDIVVSREVNLDVIARGTTGFSGADLANLVNQAAIRASKANARQVTNEHLEWAKDKILMGAERKSAVITEEDKKMTAYHEGGHTLVALYTKGATPLHKVTVMPRGRALGVTVSLPERDVTNRSRKEMHTLIDVAMGGRAAEEIIYGADNVSTGCSSDLDQATNVARQMVTRFGMSDKVGLTSFTDDDWTHTSAATKAMIEQEVNTILQESYNRVVKLLKSKESELHKLANALVEYETLDKDQVKHVVKGL
ncbi:peptidase family M41-domain-containing protein [Gorgonomyces haynaldii]|nr:peptidase family M41-domain-containing protein [Gorgonomyces haynaldii]